VPRLVDLSHPIADGMQAYPPYPGPRIGAYWTWDESRSRFQGKAEFLIGKVEMVGNTGTYLDAPYHRFPDAPDLAALPLESLAGLPGVVVDAPAARRAADLPLDAAQMRGRAVLFRTGWDARWQTPAYWEPGPFLPADVVDRLVAARVALVGVDFANVDDTQDLSRPAHTRLLAARIPIVEHLAGLAALPREGFRFTAVPPPLVKGASFPVRAFAEI
jgi:arylformamidase